MAQLTKLTTIDFKTILTKYSLGTFIQAKHITIAIANTVYKLKTTKGTYILKVHERTKPHFLTFQVKLIKHCHQHGIPTPQLMKTRSGHDILRWKGKRISIQKYVEGNMLKKPNQQLISEITKAQAHMNKALLRLKVSGKFSWGPEWEFTKNKRAVTTLQGFDIKTADEEALRALQKLDRTHMRKSVVHGDLQPSNMLVKKGKLVAVLDWDDAHEGYLFRELSVFITSLFVRPEGVNVKGIKKYLKEFTEILPLTEEELKATYYGIPRRLLGGAFWVHSLLEKHPDQKKKLLKEIEDKIIRYKQFKKISLEEFLDQTNN